MKNFILGAILIIALLGGAYVIWQNQTVPAVPATVVGTDGNTNTQPLPGETPAPDTSSTPASPVPTTNASAASTDTTAVVTGTVNPEGAITTYWYEYGTTKDLGKSTAQQAIGSGFSARATPGYITGLTKNTTYYFKLVAQNSLGTVAGEQYSFVTSSFSSAPVGGIASATTMAASGITANSVVLKGSVNPNKASTQYWFEIGKDGTLGGVTALTSAGDASEGVTASVPVTGLESGTTYYYRINAQNKYGTVNGAILTFKTGGKVVTVAPVVTTQVALSTGVTTAVVAGTVNPYGVQTSYWFEYATDPKFAAVKTSQKKSLGAVSTTVSVQATLTGLKTATTYYVRIVAENSGGTVKGDSQTFQTK